MAAAGLRKRRVSSVALDHVGVVTRDLAALARQYERLGFTLTPLARQTDGRIGNRCAMLRQAISSCLPSSTRMPPVPRWIASLHAMPASTFWRSPSTTRRPRSRGCSRAGVEAPAVGHFDRAIDDPDPAGPRARFALIQLPDQPEGRINLVHHLTPEALWQERFLRHANNAAALDEVTVVVAQPAETAARFSRLVGCLWCPIRREASRSIWRMAVCGWWPTRSSIVVPRIWRCGAYVRRQCGDRPPACGEASHIVARRPVGRRGCRRWRRHALCAGGLIAHRDRLGPLYVALTRHYLKPVDWSRVRPRHERVNRSLHPRPGGSGLPFIYGIIGLVVAVLMLGTGAFIWLSGGGTASLVGGPFMLEDGNGKQVTDRDFRGKYMLVYFGYTFCPDVCPTTLNEVADALDHLGAKADRLQPIFITVDPKRDTPAVMKQYAAAFTPRLIGLTGTAGADRQGGEGIPRLLRRASHRPRAERLLDGSQFGAVPDGTGREIHRADPRRRGWHADGGRSDQS